MNRTADPNAHDHDSRHGPTDHSTPLDVLAPLYRQLDTIVEPQRIVSIQELIAVQSLLTKILLELSLQSAKLDARELRVMLGLLREKILFVSTWQYRSDRATATFNGGSLVHRCKTELIRHFNRQVETLSESSQIPMITSLAIHETTVGNRF
ncbi:MAG: hypothetical protein ACRDAM_06180 [Casimicrobium sp.]